MQGVSSINIAVGVLLAVFILAGGYAICRLVDDFLSKHWRLILTTIVVFGGLTTAFYLVATH